MVVTSEICALKRITPEHGKVQRHDVSRYMPLYSKDRKYTRGWNRQKSY